MGLTDVPRQDSSSIDELFQRHLPRLMQTLQDEFESISALTVQEARQDQIGNVVHSATDGTVAAVVNSRKIEVAIDSGSVETTMGPEDLPEGMTPSGNPDGAEFRGANNSPIARYGHVDLLCRTKNGQHGSRVEISDVNRCLQSVSKTTGPEEHPTGLQDVLFNNRKCYVVQPGVVDAVMNHLQAVCDFDRRGGLYITEMEISDFTRQGQGR